jgi:hypothetical protein
MRLLIGTSLFFCFFSVCSVRAQCLRWPQGAAHISSEAVLTIELEKPAIRPGDSAMLHVQLRNATKRTLELVETFVQRDYELHIVDSDGVEPPLTEYGKGIRRQPIIDFRRFGITLAPGETLKADEDIARVYSITKPGRYRVAACRVVDGLGPVLSNTVSLEVR